MERSRSPADVRTAFPRAWQASVFQLHHALPSRDDGHRPLRFDDISQHYKSLHMQTKQQSG